MATITTRVQGDSPKGSPLTNAEVDNNFINLNDDKVEKSGDTLTGSLKTTDNTTFAPIFVDGGNVDAHVLRISSDASSYSGAHGFSLMYMGSRSTDDNSLSIFSDNQNAATQVEAIRIQQSGEVRFSEAPTVGGTAVTLVGHTHTLSEITDAGTAAAAATTDFATSAQGTLADSAVQPNDSPSFGSISVTGTVDGRDVAADGAKLDGIESGATADQTAAEILTAIKTVDGSGSGLDADLLDGQHGSYYYSPSNAPDPTLTLSGDASGSATFTNLGNATLSVTVNNDSHTHSSLYEDSTITYGTGRLQWTDLSSTGGTGLSGSNPTNPTSDWYHHLVMNHANSGGYYVDLAACFHHDGLYMRRLTNGSLGSWQRFFSDAYHPNADTLTTARSIGLTGDVTGSANFDGSADISITATVNDGSGSGLDADKLDGVEGSSYLRSDASDTFTSLSGTSLTVSDTITATAFSGDGSSLTGIDAGATGGGSDKIFWENDQTVTTNYTISNGKNAMSAGPITINSGVTVTIGTGETWTVV